MSETEKEPLIRFKGFTEAWKQRRLGKTLKDLKSGLSRMLSNKDIGLPVVRANNINDGQFDMKNDVKYWYIDDPQGANTDNYLIHKNDILINFINSEAKMGTATIVDEEPSRKTIYTTNILKAQIEEGYYANFWFSLTQTYRYKMDIKIITKPAVNQASFTTVDFKKLSYGFPIYVEQQKIGTFFRTLDTLITLHQHKCDLLEQTKKTCLQKLFPRDGENVPKMRFAGFEGEWEGRTLGEVLVKNSRKNKDLSISRVESVSNKTGFTKQTEQFDDYSVASEDLSNYYVIKEKYFAYNPSRINVGSIAYKSDGEETSVVSPLYISFSTNELIKDSFLWFWFKTSEFKRQRQILSEGGVRDTLSYNQLSNMIILLPDETEQTLIGTFFYTIDTLTTHHQQKLATLKSIKKTLLNQMFI